MGFSLRSRTSFCWVSALQVHTSINWRHGLPHHPLIIRNEPGTLLHSWCRRDLCCSQSIQYRRQNLIGP